MENRIAISASAHGTAVIRIEGVIGTPENVQFAEQGEKISTYEKFSGAAERIAALGSREVLVDIRSMGGNVAEALLIYEALCALDARITTRCWGYVASAATVIAQAASPGCREISANALYLVHRSVSSAKGNGNEIKQTIELLDKTDRRIASIYAGRCGKSAESFMELMDRNNGNGRWLTPKEALEASLVDRIIGSAPIENDAARTAEELGLPALPALSSLPPLPASLSAVPPLLSPSAIPPSPEGQPTNQKNKQMTLLEKWNAIVQIISQSETPEAAVGEDLLAQIEQLRGEHQAEVAALHEQVAQLEAQNAKLRSRPTVTKPREDASFGEPRRTSNQQAYEDDIKIFR